MGLVYFTRRSFLKTTCIFAGGLMVGLRITAKAVAATKAVKEYMQDRLQGVYGADARFKIRASQDNLQVKKLYKNYLGAPLGQKSEQLLHTRWVDRSGHLTKIKKDGLYPNPRAAEFGRNYPYEG